MLDYFNTKKLTDSVADEFDLIYLTANPPVPASTQFIWILSSRHDVFKEHVNCFAKSVVYEPNTDIVPEEEQCDIKGDFMRIQAALEIGNHLSGLSPENAPVIIYNGLPEQNNAFRHLLATGDLKSLKLPDYPKDRIVILELNESEYHTGGQFNSIAKESLTHPLLKKLNEPNTEVTIVTHAYHGPRVRRLFGSQKFMHPFPDAKVTLHLVDREYSRQCVQRDLKGEFSRVVKYLESGDIGNPRTVNWYDHRPETWTPLRRNKKFNDMVQTVSDRYDLNLGDKLNEQYDIVPKRYR